MVWHKPTNRFSDCYFCLTQITGHFKKSKAKIVYPDCPSASRPLDHAFQGILIPIPLSFLDINSEINDGSNASPQYAASLESSASDTTENVDKHFTLSKTPHLLDQSDLNDLDRDLGLTKEKSEVLALRVKQWNLLQRVVKALTIVLITHILKNINEF